MRPDAAGAQCLAPLAAVRVGVGERPGGTSDAGPVGHRTGRVAARRPLRYAARSSDPGLAGAEVRGGVLIVVSGEDGREGTATITVTATDADGLSAELTFEVTLESMPRGFMRGWRRALIEGILE